MPICCFTCFSSLIVSLDIFGSLFSELIFSLTQTLSTKLESHDYYACGIASSRVLIWEQFRNYFFILLYFLFAWFVLQ